MDGAYTGMKIRIDIDIASGVTEVMVDGVKQQNLTECSFEHKVGHPINVKLVQRVQSERLFNETTTREIWTGRDL